MAKARRIYNPDDPRLRVMLLLPSLHGGGAERVAVHLINGMDKSRFNVRIGLLSRGGPYLSQVDPALIDVPDLGSDNINFDKVNSAMYKPGTMLKASVLVPFSIAAMMKPFAPHVMMSFRKGTSIGAMIGTRIYGRRKVAWVAREGNNTLSVINEELRNPLGRWFVRTITKRCYKSADTTLAISRRLSAMLQRDLKIPSTKLRTIYNAVDLAKVKKAAAEPLELPPGDPYIIAVGRLDVQKGFDVLMRAYAASKSRTTHRLLILGRGPKEHELKALAGTLGITDRLVMPGWDDNPFRWVARAALFVMTSRWEGFGNVVVEAMACKVPVAVTNCDFGPPEIVQDGKCGLVFPVDDVQATAAAMDTVLSQAPLRQRLIRDGYQRATDFDVPKIVAQYEELFMSAAKKRGLLPAPMPVSAVLPAL